MLKLDHVTVIAPTLIEGVSHVQNCLDLDVPFGTRHDYMGTHNHRFQLGDSVYLEIIALDPEGAAPERPRWFGLDNQDKVRSDWNAGRRLRGWVASTTAIDDVVALHGAIFGDKVPLPNTNPTFDFTIPNDGSLPLNGAAPSIIDHRGDPTPMASFLICARATIRSPSNIRTRSPSRRFIANSTSRIRPGSSRAPKSGTGHSSKHRPD